MYLDLLYISDILLIVLQVGIIHLVIYPFYFSDFIILPGYVDFSAQEVVSIYDLNIFQI